MKQETKRKIEISNLHEFADSLILIDNRIDRCKKHQASTIVLIAISAVICGADTWNSIEDFGKSKESFFAAKLSNFNGIPSHDTFNRFFSALDPLKFEESYRQWVQSILKCYSGHIAIDGKTIRGAYESEQDKRHRKQGVLPDSNTGKYKLHVISAFATELGISLGQLCTQEKENEIVVIPELLDMLCIKDCIITIDALGCQRTIAEKVIKGEGDYIFIVKDNQPKLKEIVLSVTESIVSKGTTVRFDKYETHEEGHGRNESRICYCCNDPGFLGADIRKKWKNIQSFGYIENTRNTNKGTTVEKRCFISSLEPDAQQILKNSREHWESENNLHWQLDVNFHEDNTRRRNISALNFSVLAKIALATLRNNKREIPINRKRLIAGWDNEFLWELILHDL